MLAWGALTVGGLIALWFLAVWQVVPFLNFVLIVVALGVLFFVLGLFWQDNIALAGIIVSALLPIIMIICWFTALLNPPAVQNLIFAGKVVNSSTDKWLNNRLVLLYLEGNEIGRATTYRGEYVKSHQGIHDGLFIISVDNPYRLTANDFAVGTNEGIEFHRDSGPGWIQEANIYHWFDELPESRLTTLSVPSKRVDYAVKVLAGDASQLPTEIMNVGSTQLKSNNTIVVAAHEDPSTSGPSGSVVSIQGIKYNTKTETVPLDKVTDSFNNCAGSEAIKQEETFSRTFIHEFEASAGVDVGVSLPIGWAALVLQLEAKYGFSEKQVDTRTSTTTITVEPGTHIEYVLTWGEQWESGESQINTGGDLVTVPFRVKTNLIATVDSQRLTCN